MTDSQKYRMHLVRAHMDYITAAINDVDSEIKSLNLLILIMKMLSEELLCTIPGVKYDSAITIISEISDDMSQFCSSKRFMLHWAGLTPGSNESASKKKSVRITRAGVYLRACISTMCLQP